MKFFLSIIFSLFVFTLGVTAFPIVVHLRPADACTLGLYLLVVVGGERWALPSAIILGVGADLWSALPFGTFLIVFPTLLGLWHVLGALVFTNRSLITNLTLVVIGSVWVHGVTYALALLLAGFSSNITPVTEAFRDFALGLVTSSIATAVLAFGVLVLMRAITARYSARFLSRGKLYAP